MNDTQRVKVTINLSEEVLTAVRGLAQKRGITVTEVFRQALSTEKFLDDVMARGEKVLITEGRKTKEIIFR